MPRAGKKKAPVEENDGLKVNVRPLGESGAWARPRACREGSPLPVGMGITRREVDNAGNRTIWKIKKRGSR